MAPGRLRLLETRRVQVDRPRLFRRRADHGLPREAAILQEGLDRRCQEDGRGLRLWTVEERRAFVQVLAGESYNFASMTAAAPEDEQTEESWLIRRVDSIILFRLFAQIALMTGTEYANQAADWVTDKGRMKFCQSHLSFDILPLRVSPLTNRSSPFMSSG
jgi:hypothetical protein